MVYLNDENTDDENDVKNIAKRYKVAVQKVPVKRGIGERNRMDADASGKNLLIHASVTGTVYSDNASDEGSFIKIKKGSRGKEKIDSADGVVLSQVSKGTKMMSSEGKDKIAVGPTHAEKENQNVDGSP